ncbi:MAG: hypothetical protein RIM84_01230 [Alphaproteobacteria bacterium]
MLALKIIAGVVIGAIVGVLLAVFAIYPLLVAAAGGRDMNGGIAMGMVTGLGPASAIIGAIVGLLIVLAPPELFKGRSGLMMAGGAAALVVGYAVLLIILHGPAKLRVDRADIVFEVRTAAAPLGAVAPTVDLWDHHTGESIALPVVMSVTNGQSVLAGRYRLDGPDNFRMALRVWLSPNKYLTAAVPTAPAIEVTQTFTDWLKVDAIHDQATGGVELAYSQTTHMYRYKAVPREQP